MRTVLKVWFVIILSMTSIAVLSGQTKIKSGSPLYVANYTDRDIKLIITHQGKKSPLTIKSGEYQKIGTLKHLADLKSIRLDVDLRESKYEQYHRLHTPTPNRYLENILADKILGKSEQLFDQGKEIWIWIQQLPGQGVFGVNVQPVSPFNKF